MKRVNCVNGMRQNPKYQYSYKQHYGDLRDASANWIFHCDPVDRHRDPFGWPNICLYGKPKH